MKTQLIALDWGTSSLRAYRLGAAGETLEERSLPLGIMQLDGSEAGFEQALDQACGDWQRAFPETPMIACGMVGSAQGWRETRYAEAPLGVDGLALLPVERPHRVPLWLVPGVIQRGVLPNVPVGGITPYNMTPYLQAGAAGFGLGSALYTPRLSPAEIGDRARAFIQARHAALG